MIMPFCINYDEVFDGVPIRFNEVKRNPPPL